MSEQTKDFNAKVLGAWENAMDRFFDKCDDVMTDLSLTPQQVREALNNGYGYEVGDEWADWSDIS